MVAIFLIITLSESLHQVPAMSRLDPWAITAKLTQFTRRGNYFKYILKSAITAATNNHCVEANQMSLPIQPEIENKTATTAPNINVLETSSLFLCKIFNLLTPSLIIYHLTKNFIKSKLDQLVNYGEIP
ncbi:hypothetical protein A2434_02440 [Candidatus Woesebacteria bacterium RIFOXYC1_FULL_41_14]|uniref:Uncharacterized protein n=1 Tax=Candidatus Woesebacteria bacterium RIFOXYD1_FULL_41_28 TaxID=1802550 RepID=A0A1F8DI77_9BACT|nr:MAG: hypothetical protein A2434_02440 [Candidatus Woesebacteria bacterium RIFOXYC1_FULL_41_14]OGM87598.1 MAG: hypothetical protein A2594_01775 [Candidatus Woesebacteria bacterium RIFOXYD1_FULL_41_28]